MPSGCLCSPHAQHHPATGDFYLLLSKAKVDTHRALVGYLALPCPCRPQTVPQSGKNRCTSSTYAPHLGAGAPTNTHSLVHTHALTHPHIIHTPTDTYLYTFHTLAVAHAHTLMYTLLFTHNLTDVYTLLDSHTLVHLSTLTQSHTQPM